MIKPYQYASSYRHIKACVNAYQYVSFTHIKACLKHFNMHHLTDKHIKAYQHASS